MIKGIDDDYRSTAHKAKWWTPQVTSNDFWASTSTAFLAYGFQAAFCPVYTSLKEENHSNGIKFIIGGMGFCWLVYTAVGVRSVYCFGDLI